MNIAEAYRYIELDEKGVMIRAISRIHRAGDLNPKEPIVDILGDY